MLYRERCYEREKGVQGVSGTEEGEAGEEVEVLPKAEWVRMMVMLRLIGTSSATVGPPADEVLNFRSLPRPVSGVGPANVSSQSLWRKPIFIYYIFFFFSRILMLQLQHGDQRWRERNDREKKQKRRNKEFFFIYNFSFLFDFGKNERYL